MKLNVGIEISGKNVLAGVINGNDSNDACFTYNSKYIESGFKPISINLPFSSQSFSSEQTRLYFEGLLPEGFTKSAIAAALRINSDDYISLLSNLGKECLGAIRIYGDNDEESVVHYKKLDLMDVKNLASEGASKSAELLIESHLSLTGATGKVGLYQPDDSDDWYLPIGIAPSTHIIKQSHVRLNNIVINEQLILMTAKRLGLDVCETFIINTGNYNDQDILLASKRFDRYFDKDSNVINCLKVPYRLHQEDFAQACGINPGLKYERPGDNYLLSMFEILNNYSSNPIEDQSKLLDYSIFNYLIGNNDGHIKNFSLMYDKDMKSIKLSPAYDLISTVVYENSTRNMAYNIGGEYNIDRITKEHFGLEAEKLHISKKLAFEHFDKLKNNIKDALSDAASELCDLGYNQAENIKDSIIERRSL